MKKTDYSLVFKFPANVLNLQAGVAELDCEPVRTMSVVRLASVVSVEPVVGRAGGDVQINALLRCVPV